MKTPQRLREAPDELPRPSAGEQAEGGLQEVLQPQAQRRLALLACQEATVSLSQGSLLRRLLLMIPFAFVSLEMLLLLLRIIVLMIPFCFGPIFCSLLWSVYLKLKNRQQMLNNYRMVQLMVMCGFWFMLVLKLWCLFEGLVVVESCFVMWCEALCTSIFSAISWFTGSVKQSVCKSWFHYTWRHNILAW